MRILTTIMVALLPVLARAQGVILSPAPAEWVNPADPWSYGISIGPGYSGVSEYGIDLDGDGVADYTLTCTYRDQEFSIIPSGSNAVLSYVVDSLGSSFVANLGEGTEVGPTSSSSPVWQTTADAGNTPQIITDANNNGVYGLFAYTSGYIGLQMYVDGQAHYGFLQIDCTGYSGEGGFYQGYGYNTIADQSITTISVPEPDTLALAALGTLLLGVRCGSLGRQ